MLWKSSEGRKVVKVWRVDIVVVEDGYNQNKPTTGFKAGTEQRTSRVSKMVIDIIRTSRPVIDAVASMGYSRPIKIETPYRIPQPTDRPSE